MNRQQWFLIGGILMGAACVSSAEAQVARSGGGENAKFMQQYQQLAAEKTALQTQIAQMKKDLDAAQAELATTRKDRDALKARPAVPATQMTQLKSARDAAEKNLDLYKQRTAELVARFRDTASNLKEVEADRTKLRTALDERNHAFDQCAADNLQLYELGGEVLDRYEHVGLFTKVEASEPFTRIKRARLDNLVDEYRARALEMRVKKTAAQ